MTRPPVARRSMRSALARRVKGGQPGSSTFSSPVASAMLAARCGRRSRSRATNQAAMRSQRGAIERLAEGRAAEREQPRLGTLRHGTGEFLDELLQRVVDEIAPVGRA